MGGEALGRTEDIHPPATRQTKPAKALALFSDPRHGLLFCIVRGGKIKMSRGM